MNCKNLPILLHIDESFFEEEIRNEHLITKEMKRIWAVELDLFNQFIKVCEKYALNWHVSGGTMLGAVRHHGFIPWDDDIDVQMPRKDYMRLCEVAAEAFKYPYFFQTEYTDPGYSRAFGKLRNSETTGIPDNEVNCDLKYNQGIFIDIFPIDNFPDDEKEKEEFIDELHAAALKMRRFFRITYGNKEQSKHNPLFRFFKATVGTCLKLFFDITRIQNPYVKRFDRIATRYDDQNTKQCGLLFFYNMSRDMWNSEDLDHCIEMPFEMLTVNVPHNYENLLESMYGDWHKMVKGGSIHVGMKFDPDTPYVQSLFR